MHALRQSAEIFMEIQARSIATRLLGELRSSRYLQIPSVERPVTRRYVTTQIAAGYSADKRRARLERHRASRLLEKES